jgi:hypothetical protein
MADESVFDDGPVASSSRAPVGSQNTQSGQSTQFENSSSQRNSGTSSNYNRNEFGSGSGTQPESESEAEPTSYPLMSFTGRGNLDHRNGSADVVQKISAVMDKATLTVSVQQFLAEGGDNKSDVNKEIEKQTGDTVYKRIDRSQTSANLVGLPGESFLIRSKSFEDRRGGKIVSFSVISGDPLPVLVVPAVESRYDELSQSPIRSTSVIQTGTKTINVSTTISGQKMGTGQYKMTIDYLIPEDQAGELYGMLPMARSTDYGIDTINKRISSITTRSVYNDDDNERARAINIGFNLCKSIQDGKIQNFASCD